MRNALQAEGPASEDLSLQLERIAEALERLAVRRKLRQGLSEPSNAAGAAGESGVISRWAFRNRGIRAALARAAARHAEGGAS